MNEKKRVIGIRRQRSLFVLPPKPQRKPRKLMHVIEAGTGCDAGALDRGERDRVRLRCPRCDHETGWILLTITEAKRGVACPACNADPPATEA